MTRFWRSGFWRTSTLGIEHWVEGHWVDRDDWDRSSGYSNLSYASERLSSLGVSSSATSRFVSPNAKCPVCGDDVFFYQNEFGSRVYFDELGPPWPKHPCTDNSTHQGTKGTGTGNFITPAFRDRESIAEIIDWCGSTSWSPEDEFLDKYGSKPWDCYKVLRRVKGAGKTLLILSGVGSDRTMYLAAQRLPRVIAAGSIVFYRRLRLAYLDTKAMQPNECEVERINGAKEFVETQFGLRDV